MTLPASCFTMRDTRGNLPMEPQDISYCQPCSQRALSSWKGWPHRDPVPLLPRIDSGPCEECGCSESLGANGIAWLNYHGPSSTGLPDYWMLVIDTASSAWGRPYFAEAVCGRCGGRAVVSEMQYPSNRHEFKLNCEQCGVQRVPRS